jgi:GLPGLI family protein
MKHLLVCLSLILTLHVTAQKDFQGYVVYESKTSVADFRMGSNREVTPEVQKMIDERMKKMSEKTFDLYFDKTASIYKEQEKLETPGTQGGGSMRMMASFAGGGGTFYKNVKDKMYTVDKEIFGKEFLVKDSLPKFDWKMTGESKKIGNYLCFKATAKVKPSKSDFRNMRRKKQEEGTEEKKPERSTNFMDQMEMPSEIDVVAWYTPDIPVSQGPEMYYGLPGLILEVVADKTVMLASKVVINPKEKQEIKAPTNGKEINQKDFDETVTKKMQEMREMYQNGRGNQMRIPR